MYDLVYDLENTWNAKIIITTTIIIIIIISK